MPRTSRPGTFPPPDRQPIFRTLFSSQHYHASNESLSEADSLDEDWTIASASGAWDAPGRLGVRRKHFVHGLPFHTLPTMTL